MHVGKVRRNHVWIDVYVTVERPQLEYNYVLNLTPNWAQADFKDNPSGHSNPVECTGQPPETDMF
jgi:hypothetical protein